MQMNDVMGYSNVENPYGDANLTEKFKWHKKREMEEKMGLSEEEARERDRQRRMETITELEKLKKRRIERELEQAQHEAEMVCATGAASSERDGRGMLNVGTHSTVRSGVAQHSNGFNASGNASCTATWRPRRMRYARPLGLWERGALWRWLTS